MATSQIALNRYIREHRVKEIAWLNADALTARAECRKHLPPAQFQALVNQRRALGSLDPWHDHAFWTAAAAAAAPDPEREVAR